MVSGYATICPTVSPETLKVCARPNSGRGIQRELREVNEGKVTDSNAPTRKRRARSRKNACWPSGVSAVKREKPQKERARIFRALQRSAITPPGICSNAYPIRKAEKTRPKLALSHPVSRMMTGAATEMLTRST